MMPPTVTPLATRLWSRVTVRGGDLCWPFTGPRRNGYGQIGVGMSGMRGGRPITASRAAWLVTYGPIPAGLHVCHSCDYPPCCRPDHLFLGTRSANMHDASSKGRLRPPGAKLTPAERSAVLARYADGETARILAAEFGVSVKAVYNLVYAHRRRQSRA